MKLFIPIINNGSGDVKAGWASCMITELQGPEVFIQNISDSHANRAMNKAACEFLKTDCDAMLVIDADITFTRKDIEKITSHDVPLVYGIYPKKHDETEPCLCTFAEVPVPDKSGLAVVRRAGRGFLFVRRELIEAMKEDNGGPALRYHNHEEVQWDFFPSGPVVGDYSALGKGRDKDGFPIREWISEDWYFCERARALGAPTLVDTRIALGHIGPKEFRFNGAQLARMDSNIDKWQDIHGWFDYEQLYRDIARTIPDGGTFVEVGSWLGRSIGALHQFTKEAGKKLKLHSVDTFCGTPANAAHRAMLDMHGGSVEAAFRANMKALGLNGELTIHAKPSLEAAAEIPDGSVDAVFIDADHSEAAVRADIEAWFPKVKRGGLLAGHDYDEDGVKAAVSASLPSISVQGRCWLHFKA